MDEKRRQALLDKVKEFRAALDCLEATLQDPAYNEVFFTAYHFRLVDGGVTEMLMEARDWDGQPLERPYHYFFARHDGGAYPRFVRPQITAGQGIMSNEV